MLTRSNVCEHNSIVHNHSYISLKKQCLSPFAFQWSTLCVRTCVSNSTSELTVCVHVRDRAAASLAAALSRAVGRFLDANKNPSRKVKEIDNRGSHYWVARYWAEELALQGEDQRLKDTFSGMAEELKEKEAAILSDMVECQGKTVDIGGYYHVDKAKADVAMNPSAIFNGIIARLAQGPDARI